MSFSHIRGIIWDLDGTLYRYDKIFLDACDLAAAHTAIDLGLKMDLDEALALARKSFSENGSSFKFFADHGIRYEDFHHPYHARVDTTILARNQEMKEALQALKIPMVILTNASRDWAKKTIGHLEYSDIFGDGNILALEDAGYQGKASSPAGFQKSLSILGVRSDETLMVEDLARNLMHAKKMGMTTALVHHGQIPQEGREYVDHYFDDTLELIRTLKA